MTERKMEKVGIDSIVPWERNPRRNRAAIKAVQASIEQTGFNRPIVVSEAGAPFEKRTICAGHTAWEAAKKLGLKEVPAVVVEMTEEQFVKYNIADNKSHELAQWDTAELAELIRGWNEVDWTAFGFMETELEFLLNSEEEALDLDLPEPEVAGAQDVAGRKMSLTFYFLDQDQYERVRQQFHTDGGHETNMDSEKLLAMLDELGD